MWVVAAMGVGSIAFNNFSLKTNRYDWQFRKRVIVTTLALTSQWPCFPHYYTVYIYIYIYSNRIYRYYQWYYFTKKTTFSHLSNQHSVGLYQIFKLCCIPVMVVLQTYNYGATFSSRYVIYFYFYSTTQQYHLGNTPWLSVVIII